MALLMRCLTDLGAHRRNSAGRLDQRIIERVEETLRANAAGYLSLQR